MSRNHDCECEESCEKHFDELSACKFHANRGKIKHLNVRRECAEEIDAFNLNVDQEVANHICVSESISAKHVKALSLNANNLCAQNGTINSLCVNNLTANNLVAPGVKYRAAVTSSAPFLYTLGTPLNWNIVLDDPNTNVALTPFSYTVPAAGYYSLSFHMDNNALLGSGTIAGIPVGLLTLLVNGKPLRSQYTPYLSFSDEQDTSLTTLELLNLGDVISMNYQVLVVDPVNGLIPYVGTVNVNANGLFAGESGFAIIFLSALSASAAPACAPCPLVALPCVDPVVIPCHRDSNDMNMDMDCDSCQ